MSPLLPCPRLAPTLDVLPNRQGRIAASNRQLQEPGNDHGREHGEALRPETARDSDSGQPGGPWRLCGAAGIEVFVFMPDDTPAINQFEGRFVRGEVFLVNGLIGDCGKIVREGMTRPAGSTSRR